MSYAELISLNMDRFKRILKNAIIMASSEEHMLCSFLVLIAICPFGFLHLFNDSNEQKDNLLSYYNWNLGTKVIDRGLDKMELSKILYDDGRLVPSTNGKKKNTIYNFNEHLWNYFENNFSSKQQIMSDDTSMLLLMYGVSVPIITSEGTFFGDFILNDNFKNQTDSGSEFKIEIIMSCGTEGVRNYLNDNKIEYFLLTPMSSETALINHDKFEILFENDGFKLFKVRDGRNICD